MQIGWGIIGCIIAGRMFSAVNGGGLSVAVGCFISALCIGFIATFSIAVVHTFERGALYTHSEPSWGKVKEIKRPTASQVCLYPQLLAIIVSIGSAGRDFDTSVVSIDPIGTVIANRCSFFALEFASIIGLSAIGADFYVYYPTTTSKRITFLTTWSGIWLALICCNKIGVAIATGVPTTPGWNNAYSISSGALPSSLLRRPRRLLRYHPRPRSHHQQCPLYLRRGVDLPSPRPICKKAIPRWMWCIIITLIEFVCSVLGRNHLFNIFENFPPDHTLSGLSLAHYCAVSTASFRFPQRCTVLTGPCGRMRRSYPFARRRCFAWLVG